MRTWLTFLCSSFCFSCSQGSIVPSLLLHLPCAVADTNSNKLIERDEFSTLIWHMAAADLRSRQIRSPWPEVGVVCTLFWLSPQPFPLSLWAAGFVQGRIS